MNNIILIGMPGSGKSTVGVLAAKMLGYGFIDSDLLIQAQENKRLFEILNDSGNEYFIKLEDKVNAGINCEKTVIATGGSVVYCENAMKHLKSIGKVIYLKVPLSAIEKRVDNFSTRGIMMKKGATLKDIYAERAPLYEKYADITVKVGCGSLTKSAEKIINAIKNT
ncbi:MAG: shikimate kinase [Clostridia bacterium]|nr:shikimate kinase [Clostridia bacterium]